MKQRIFDFIFIAAASILCISILYIAPVRGIADQGDFERVMIPAGLDFLDRAGHNFYGFIEQRYAMRFMYPHDIWLYPLRLAALIPSTSYLYPILIAKLLCLPFGVFDTRALAAVMCFCYIAACAALLRRVRTGRTVTDILTYALVLLIFFDGVTVTMFNSLYGQSMMTLALAVFLLAAVTVIQNFDRLCRAHLLFLFAGCILLLGAKLQCAVFLPLFAVMWLYLLRHTGFKKLTVVMLCLTVWYGAGGYIINGHGLNQDTQYNSVFYGILKDSPDPAHDLQTLGLSPSLAADAGKHAYLDASEYAYPPRSEILQTEFYDKMSNAKLISFYLTHPSRLLAAMEKTANHAFYNRIDLGTFARESGQPEGASAYRGAFWSAAADCLPKTLRFIAPVYLLFLAGGLYEAVRHKNKYAYLFLMALLMGALQFPMPYLGNGNADITKQLYLFNEIFYLGMAVSARYIITKIHMLHMRRHHRLICRNGKGGNGNETK